MQMVKKPDLFNREYQKEQSETYRYKHIHTGEYCTFEAYVAEYLIIRRAEIMGLARPSYKFWTKGDPNHWVWIKQLNAARALKVKYSEEAILSAIKSKDFDKLLLIGLQNGRGWKINPKAESIIKKHNYIIKNKKVEETKIEVTENPKTRTQSYGKGSLLNKLRGK